MRVRTTRRQAVVIIKAWQRGHAWMDDPQWQWWQWGPESRTKLKTKAEMGGPDVWMRGQMDVGAITCS